jgi:hypothetical protein
MSTGGPSQDALPRYLRQIHLLVAAFLAVHQVVVQRHRRLREQLSEHDAPVCTATFV